MSTVQDPRKTWLATGSLLTVWWRMLGSGAEIAPCLRLWLLFTCLSPFGRGKGPVCSQLALLWYLLNPLFREWARFGVRAFRGKFLCFSFLAIPQFRLLSHISSLRLSSGHSGAVLSLSMQPMPPCPAPGSRWWPMRVWATSPLGVAVRLMFCGFCFFFLSVMLPSEIPKLPTDLFMRGLSAVWKVLLLHDSLPRTGLYP